MDGGGLQRGTQQEGKDQSWSWGVGGGQKGHEFSLDMSDCGALIIKQAVGYVWGAESRSGPMCCPVAPAAQPPTQAPRFNRQQPQLLSVDPSPHLPHPQGESTCPLTWEQ